VCILSCKTQHAAVLTIRPLYLQTTIIAQMMSIGGEGVTECMQQLQLLQLLLQLTSCPRRWTVENQASVSLVWPDSPRGSQAAALRGRLYTPQRTPRICNIRDIQLLLLLLLYLFNGLFSRIISVSRYQKGKTSLDLNETRDEANSSASDSLDSHDRTALYKCFTY